MGVLLGLSGVEEDSNALAKLPADTVIISFQVVRSKGGSTESRLESVDIVNLEVLPYCHASSTLLILLNIEAAVLVFVGLVQFLHEEGELLGPGSS